MSAGVRINMNLHPNQPVRAQQQRRGLSLIELIMGIALVGVLAMLSAPLLRMPLLAWQDASASSESLQSLEVARSSLAQDLASALPGSVRVRSVGGRSSLELLRVRAWGRARAGSGGATANCPVCSAPGTRDELETTCNDTCFAALGALEGDVPVPGSDWVVLATAGADPYLGGNAAVAGGSKTRFTSQSPGPEGPVIRMGAHRFANLPPSKRFYLVAEPVSWDCNPANGTLSRAHGYPIAAVQPLAFAGAVANSNFATGVTACSWLVLPATGTGGTRATVQAQLRLNRAGQPGTGTQSLDWVAQFALPEGPL